MAKALGIVFKALAWALMLATPLLGVWAASSLAAYANARVGWVAASGLLLFPIGPLAWVGLSEWRRRRRGVTRPHILTFADRLILRTIVLNVAFLAILIATRPKVAFVALSARGDWFLRDRHGAVADRVRRGAFRVAGGLEWLYEATHPNPYEKLEPHDTSKPTPAPTSTTTAGPVLTDKPKPWPTPHELESVVSDIPPAEEQSIESVGKYIAAHEHDPLSRVKALHDWVADRIAYDGPRFVAGTFTAEDEAPSTVFARRVGVCAGYAQLLAALGKVTGDEIVYVVGNVRTLGTPIDGAPHAWNAAHVGGVWYLLDATFDSGYLDGSTFHKKYSTDYLFTPADVFGVSHFPDDPAWQLRDKPISRGDFIRQPMMQPAFYARGLRLDAPDRSQITVRGRFDVRLENVRTRLLMSYAPVGFGGEGTPCAVDGFTHASCDLPRGKWDVLLFGSEAGVGEFDHLGTFEVNSN